MSTSLILFADPSCPWCYLATFRFESARTDFDPDIFIFETAPFLINPDLPVNGMEFPLYLMARYGNQKAIAEALAPLQKAAEEEALPLNLAKIKIMPNTLKAQILLHYARELEVDYPLFRAMQEAYFVKGLDLSQSAVLRALGEEFGLDGQVISAILNDGLGEEAVLSEIGNAVKMGVHEVPTFMVGHSYLVPGVQSTSFWRNVISEIDEQGRNLAKSKQN